MLAYSTKQHHLLVILGCLYLVKIGDTNMISLKKEKDAEMSFVFDSEIGDPSRHSKQAR